MAVTPRGRVVSRWDDGLLDLFIGLAMLLVGLTWMTPMAGLGGLAPAVLLLLWVPARRRVVARRVEAAGGGSEARTPKRRSSVAILLIVLALGTLGGLVLVRAGRATGEWIAMGVPALPGVLLGIGAVAVGLLLGVARVLAHGVLMALLAAGATALGVGPAAYMAFTGTVVAGVGVVLLRRFVREHPTAEGAGDSPTPIDRIRS